MFLPLSKQNANENYVPATVNLIYTEMISKGLALFIRYCLRNATTPPYKKSNKLLNIN